MEERIDYIVPTKLSKKYYNFSNYNSKSRILTYWYQIDEVLQCSSGNCLEIGVGSGLVKSYLEHVGLSVDTMDINPELKADYHDSLLNIEKGELKDKKYDLVLCSRVLHHLEFEQFNNALRNLSHITRKNVIITLPVDELRIYTMFKITSTDIYTQSLKIPFLKKLLRKILPQKYSAGSGLWQVNSENRTKKNAIVKHIEKYFKIIKSYQIPEDSSHWMLVLEKK
jgi:ubiquinone/menaquinone biosynthesis C-methylase UbiE